MISTLTKKHSFDQVFDSQAVYRRILSAMANPGTTVDISASKDKLFGAHPALLAVAMTLLDNEVSFSAPGSISLLGDVASLTLARAAETESADFIFITDPADLPCVIRSAKCGTLADPDRSAMIVVLDDGEPCCPLTLAGPGIDNEIKVNATELLRDAMISRNKQHYEYPEGIDFLFLRSGGELLAIPRLVRMVD